MIRGHRSIAHRVGHAEMHRANAWSSGHLLVRLVSMHSVDREQQHAPSISATCSDAARVIMPVSPLLSWFAAGAIPEPLDIPPKTSCAKLPRVVTGVTDTRPVHSAPTREKRKEKVREFRRRLMDLYLLDAYNESSGEDVLEWAELDDAQKEAKACWKANLEDVLVRVGLQRPQVGLVSSSVPARSRLHAKRMFSSATRICSLSCIIASPRRRRGCSCSYSSTHTRRRRISQRRQRCLRLIH